MHDVDDQDGDVAEGGAAITEVGEGLVAGGVDDQEAGQFQIHELKKERNDEELRHQVFDN